MHQLPPVNHPLSKWQESLWLLVALLIPLFVNFWVEQQFEASKIWLLRTLVWTMAGLWLWGWVIGLRPKPIPIPIRNLVVLLVLILVLATLLSTHPFIALFGTLERANGVLTQLTYLLLFACVATQINPNHSRQLLFVITLTAIPICMLGLAQATGWQPLPVQTDARSLITTSLGRANFTGAYLAMLLPLTLAAAQSSTTQSTSRSKWQPIAYGALFGLELSVILLTQARAAWVAAAVGISVLWWLHHAPRWTQRGRWLTALGGVAAVIGTLLLLVPRGLADGGSIAARWTIWQASLRLLWPHLWLGYGADTLELYFPSVYPPQLVYYQGRGVTVDRAHNWLLDWSLNYGVVATVILSALIMFILRAGWQQLAASAKPVATHTEESPLGNHWIAACVASICALLVGNLFLFEVAATATLFWLLLAILTATITTVATSQGIPKTPPHSQPRGLRASGLRSTAIAIIIIVVGWAVWQVNITPLLADVHSWRGTKAVAQGNLVVALGEYKAATQYQPQRAAYHVAAALTAAQIGNFVQAEQGMRQAIVLRPLDPVLYTQLATIYARQASQDPEHVALAYATYEKAIALAPTIALTYQQYADLALRFGDVELARSYAQQAVDLDATDGIAYGILGWTHLQAGNLETARVAFEQAVNWQPDSADFHLGLATVYFQQGDIEAARQTVQASLMLDPFYAPALTLQSILQGQ